MLSALTVLSAVDACWLETAGFLLFCLEAFNNFASGTAIAAPFALPVWN